ncbi:hypothetical protein F4810DRAFT_709227 [Camillea tinctor]|nr:hypothetical protein F4810DRAFT_709227 [Camillea tinctor]
MITMIISILSIHPLLDIEDSVTANSQPLNQLISIESSLQAQHHHSTTYSADHRSTSTMEPQPDTQSGTSQWAYPRTVVYIREIIDEDIEEFPVDQEVTGLRPTDELDFSPETIAIVVFAAIVEFVVCFYAAFWILQKL